MKKKEISKPFLIKHNISNSDLTYFTCYKHFPLDIQMKLDINFQNAPLLNKLYTLANDFLIRNNFKNSISIEKNFYQNQRFINDEKLHNALDFLIKDKEIDNKLKLFFGLLLNGLDLFYSKDNQHCPIKDEDITIHIHILNIYKKLDFENNSINNFVKEVLDLTLPNYTNISFYKNIMKLISKENSEDLFKKLFIKFYLNNCFYECEEVLNSIKNEYERDLLKLKLRLKQKNLPEALKLLKIYEEDWDFTHEAVLNISCYYRNSNDLDNALKIIETNLFSIYSQLTSEEKLDIQLDNDVQTYDHQLQILSIEFFQNKNFEQSQKCKDSIINHKN